jgi:hypothetical protein
MIPVTCHHAELSLGQGRFFARDERFREAFVETNDLGSDSCVGVEFIKRSYTCQRRNVFIFYLYVDLKSNSRGRPSLARCKALNMSTGGVHTSRIWP